jgi:hypothetical protein
MSEEKEVVFNTLGDAIKFVEDQGEKAQEAGRGFATAFKELTGMEPQRTVNAMDVVKICFAIYGEPRETK